MGLNTSYTLYFKGVNDLENKILFPIITLGLKDMDKFTANYEDEVSMFRCLPRNVKKYIEDNLSYNINLEDKKSMKNKFIIKNDKTNKNVDLLFFSNADIIYIRPKELREKISKLSFSFDELQLYIRNRKDNNLIVRYNFLNNIYEEYVKDKDLEKMIDTYDVKKRYPKLDKDKLVLYSLLTDKNNIIVATTKVGQQNINKRNLAIEYKKIDSKLCKEKLLEDKIIKERFNSGLDIVEMKKNILNNFKIFKKLYIFEDIK